MKILVRAMVVMCFLLAGCATLPVQTTYNELTLNGKTITLGMQTQDVLSAFGTPTEVIVPYDYKPQQFWHYGPSDGPEPMIQVFFNNGTVARINRYEYPKK